MKTAHTFVLGACLVATMQGCFVGTSNDAPPPPESVVGTSHGRLTVRWTVAWYTSSRR
jgi:hypothetical protein